MYNFKLIIVAITLALLSACGQSKLEGKYDNAERHGLFGHMLLTINPDKTANIIEIDKGKKGYVAPYNVTDKTLQIQGSPWSLTIYDDGSLDGSTALGVFKKMK